MTGFARISSGWVRPQDRSLLTPDIFRPARSPRTNAANSTRPKARRDQLRTPVHANQVVSSVGTFAHIVMLSLPLLLL